MRVKLKLMGMIKDKTPPTGELDVSENATIEDVLNALQIPLDSVTVFSVNGSLVREQSHHLQPNDELTVLPPVGGG